MTNPVILLGTQSNGETLPVQVDEFGRLVAEGLQGSEGQQGPKGDKGDKGDPGEPGADGSPGADGADGEGVPQPYGEEGSYLAIQDGVPAWVEGGGEGPGPGPDPEPPVRNVAVVTEAFTGNDNRVGFRNESGQLSDPPDGWDESARMLTSWSSPSHTTPLMGVSRKGNTDMVVHFNIQNCLGQVLEITTNAKFQASDVGSCSGKITFNDSHLTAIRDSDSFGTGYPDPLRQRMSTYQFLCNRNEHLNVECTYRIVVPYLMYNEKLSLQFMRWELKDPGRVALERQLEHEAWVKSRVRRLLEKRSTRTTSD
jgi:hypothetical protein